MSTVDDLLAQSLLLHRPQVPSDTVPHDDLAYAGLGLDDLPPGDGHGTAADDDAAQSLAALCETVVARCTPDQLADFLTDQVPQPRAAWILGCVLQLAGAEDGARFWWQYAAGADDAPASYCLHLQHLARGDTHAAALWGAQAGARGAQDPGAGPGDDDTPAYRLVTADTSISTVLRVLSGLSHAVPRRHTPEARAVIEFVAAAVAIGYDHHPDLEIPMPGTGFAEQLQIIVAAASALHDRALAVRPDTGGTLPNRPPLKRATGPAPARDRTRGPDRLLVEVTSADHEPASAHVFFKEAVAVCWEAATTAGSADGRGTRMAYYLNRFRTRAARALSPTASATGAGSPAGASAGQHPHA
jgi:hypothetical protein